MPVKGRSPPRNAARPSFVKERQDTIRSGACKHRKGK